MSHATMCGSTNDDGRHGCFVPWCSCWCHNTQADVALTPDAEPQPADLTEPTDAPPRSRTSPPPPLDVTPGYHYCLTNTAGQILAATYPSGDVIAYVTADQLLEALQGAHTVPYELIRYMHAAHHPGTPVPNPRGRLHARRIHRHPSPQQHPALAEAPPPRPLTERAQQLT